MTLRRDALCVAVGAGHRFADRTSIALSDLNGERMHFFPRHLAPRYHDAILAAVHMADARVEVWDNPLPGLRAASSNLNQGGFMLLPTPVPTRLPGVAVLPVRDDLPLIDLELLWRTRYSRPAGPA